MRLWTTHPKYLDAQGLTALWREALLARKVLRGKTKGYRHHPQLERFRAHRHPLRAIALYLSAVHDESRRRGYRFDKSKIGRLPPPVTIEETEGQLLYEWARLKSKLRRRSPAQHRSLRGVRRPEPHPLFRLTKGGVRSWERVPKNARLETVTRARRTL